MLGQALQIIQQKSVHQHFQLKLVFFCRWKAKEIDMKLHNNLEREMEI